ncbi:recombinase family protein [Streptomyces sp. NPDC059378]|uniref:recombinase family protein n=1 Tax=Streptomyces sp. NPDC059378 TaxID=3346815 RepID=UPI0036A3B605
MPNIVEWPSGAAADRVRCMYYVRQSHKNETDSLSSPLAQRRAAEAYIQSQAASGWELVGGFEDIGISGYDPDAYRPGFEDMMTHVRERKVDVVVIFALSRLTRQGAKEALRLHDEMRQHGVALVSTTEPFINTSHDNPFSVAFFALIAALAEQESRNKSAFITNSLNEIRTRGGHTSGPVPYGMEAESINVDGVTIRTLKPDTGDEPNHLNVVRMVELAEEGTAGHAIARKLTAANVPIPSQANVKLAANLKTAKKKRNGNDDAPPEWSATVVLRTLRDPRIAGFAIDTRKGGKALKREILHDETGRPVRPHVGIISPARWYKLQEVLDKRKVEKIVPRDGGEMTLLGSWGMLRCGKCGSGMTVSRADSTYVCNLRRTVGDVPAHVLRVPMADVDHAAARMVWTRVRALNPETDPKDTALLAEAVKRFTHNNANPEVEAELLAVKAQLTYVQRSIAQTAEERDDYQGPTGRKVWREQMAKLAHHEAECLRRQAELTAALTVTQEVPLIEWAGSHDDPMDAGAPWSAWTTEQRRGFLTLWAERIVVAPAPPRSEWHTTIRNPEAVYRRTFDRVSVEWARPAVDEDGEFAV